MTDAAQVRVMNDALFQLGQEPVTDLSEASLQGSAAATKLMRVIDQSLDAVLSRHGWVEALEYVTLPPAVLPNYVNWRYPSVFLAPADCLQVWEINGEVFNSGLVGGWGPRWQVGKVETADAAQTIIRASSTVCGLAGTLDHLDIAYVRRVNWQALGASLRDAVAFDLAARGAYNITGDKAVAAGLKKDAEGKVMLAIGADGTQEGGQPAAAPSIPAMLRNLSR